MLGNEAADTGDYQVGVRVAVALDRPIVTGVKGLEIRDDAVVARREAAGGGWEVYEVARPAVMSVREGLNLPRYPSVPGRLRARKKEVERIAPTRAAATTARIRLRVPVEQESAVEILGEGPEAAPRVVEVFRRLGSDRMILVVVEHDGERPGPPVGRGPGARALPRGGDRGAAPRGRVGAGRGRHRRRARRRPASRSSTPSRTPRLDDHAPEAIGKALAQLIERDGPTAVIGTAATAAPRSWPTPRRGPGSP